MKTQKLKRMMSLFLAALICVTTLVGFGTTAYAAEETDEVCLVSFPRDGDANYGGEWGHGSFNFMNGWFAQTSRYTTVRAMGSYDGNICYCIEPGVPQESGDRYTKKGENFWDNYPSSYNHTISPDDKALDNVSFAVEKGEFVSIIGPSGSGKSTLLHILAGIDRPTSGKVYVDGEDIYAKSEKELAYYRRRKAGLIYQFYNLVPTLTVEENITLPCRLDKKKTDKETLDRLLDTLGMKERRSHLPSQLSGGQQQRCAIGRVLFTNPALMLADEPTGNLDSKSAAEVMELLGSANKQYGQTLIMITHNLELAKLADRMLIIKDGKLSEG